MLSDDYIMKWKWIAWILAFDLEIDKETLLGHLLANLLCRFEEKEHKLPTEDINYWLNLRSGNVKGFYAVVRSLKTSNASNVEM